MARLTLMTAPMQSGRRTCKQRVSILALVTIHYGTVCIMDLVLTDEFVRAGYLKYPVGAGTSVIGKQFLIKQKVYTTGIHDTSKKNHFSKIDISF